MAPPIHLTPANHFDIEQLLVEAQRRWLRTPEICEILRNYKHFNIAPEPPNMPPSGSLFLFDKKVLRYFRKDGHRWRKKKDGKTIKEAHERLKAGSIDVLHCYYAHGEDNENFQRRSYWMLEEKLSHIVLVHYREVKGYKTNFNRFKETEEAIVNSLETEQSVPQLEADNSINSGLQQNSCQVSSHNTASRSLKGAQASDYEVAESGNFQAKSTAVSSLEIDEDQSSQKHCKEIESLEREDALESHNVRVQSASVKPSLFDVQPDSVRVKSKQENVLAMHLLTDPVCEIQASRDLVQGQKSWQVSGEDAMHFGSACILADTFMPNPHDHVIINSMRMDKHNLDSINHQRSQPSVSACLEGQPDVKSNLTIGKKTSHFSASRTISDRPVNDKVLKKCDSFSQWMCKELGDVEPVIPSSGAYWDADDKRNDCPILLPVAAELDSYTHDPSLSQDQSFRIIDFAPSWGYAGSETKVLITGKFLNTQQDTKKYQWSCVFGEMEVPAEVIADGVLRCYAPPLGMARVHFYVTWSNKKACSDVREFEYRDKLINSFDSTSLSNRCDALLVRFCKLLSSGSTCPHNSQPGNWASSSGVLHEISSLHKGIDSEWFQILELTSKDKFSLDEVKDKLAEKFMKEKLYEWLLFKKAEGGNGLRSLDENGHGALHLAAALGYDWAISPIVAIGVSINFRDVRGWTALHWAAYYGREHTVAYLISLGAYAGALTDPTPTNPMGRTPADLASKNDHNGIAGFLAESALSAHLESLTLKDEAKHNSPVEPYGMTSVLTASERMATPVSGDNLEGLSLKDSLAALCNATQAAARIHQVYRARSFREKQMSKHGSDKIETPDEYALSVISLKSHKQGQHDEPVHAASVRIQSKFRSWKGRRNFLTLKKKIVQIQAHVRGHQVRKHYKAFVWSVGIVEKVILRWRRRRSGLRGFKSEYLTVKSLSEGTSSKDDYDFIKQGRKQAEERLQKALSRVKSMVRCPEARDQYRRLLTTVREIEEMKGGCSGAIDETCATVSMEEDLVDLDTLLNGGTTH